MQVQLNNQKLIENDDIVYHYYSIDGYGFNKVSCISPVVIILIQHSRIQLQSVVCIYYKDECGSMYLFIISSHLYRLLTGEMEAI